MKSEENDRNLDPVERELIGKIESSSERVDTLTEKVLEGTSGENIKMLRKELDEARHKEKEFREELEEYRKSRTLKDQQIRKTEN